MDRHLLEYCDTDTQRLYIETFLEEGSYGKTAKKLGRAKSTILQAVHKIKERAASKGYSPEHGLEHSVPSPFFVKGTSQCWKKGEDEPILTWVKSAISQDQQAALMEASANEFFKDQTPPPLIEPPQETEEELLSVYVLADLHIGMFSWARETGSDYDTDIASKVLEDTVDRLITKMPYSKYCLIAQLGDLLHLDDDTNQTRRGKNALDVDTRYFRIAEVGLRIYRRLIDRCLMRHDHVKIINVPGNHDSISSMWIGLALKAAYESDPRVTIDTGPGAYFYHQFGKCLIGCCHGHTTKMQNLEGIMLADRPKATGETLHRYWYTGHIHHDRSMDLRNCRVESFRTLAARDAWHDEQGYRSKRDMKAMVLHLEQGEIERYTVGVRDAVLPDPS